MKILVGQSYFRCLDPKEANRNMPYPPLGPIILATYLEELGYEIHFFDSMMAKNADEIFSTIDTIKPDLVLLYDDEFNYLTKMALLNMREHTFRITTYLEKRDIQSVVYTSDAIDHPDLYLKAGADFIVIGEGETVIEELLEQLDKNNESYDTVSGLVYMDNGLRKNEKKPLRAELDDLPPPNYGKFVNVSDYKQVWYQHHGYFSMNITTSRGCTYGCNWCAKPLWGRTYNAHSPERIAKQFKDLEENYGVDHIWITDDIFGLKKDWLKQFAAEINKLNVNVPYKCLSRADLLCKTETLDYLKESNCQTIWIGAESGSQKILDKMEKGTTVEQIYHATKMTKERGMEIAYFLQLGYLGEKWEDIQLTRKLVRDNIPADIGISVSYPLPGTKFYDMVESHLSSKQNWNDSADLDMMFHGTYSRNFYRALHQLIHNEYRYHKTLAEFGISKIPKLLYHRSKLLFFEYKVNSMRTEERTEELENLPIVN